MAKSRTERIGTIFSRVTSLIRANALALQNVPIWYDVYKAFPPKYEPRFNRIVSNKEIQDIFYDEDCIRAKFQEDVKIPAVNLKNNKASRTEIFLALYNSLLSVNNNNKEKAYMNALEKYNEMFLSESKPAKNMKIDR
ncbi:PREDICTED: 28S ribosomal protein S23, mitochondrial [Eufriesea mexicana]|uniref:28S ribosomal protein S23, mitochondrial n=1 Tax=Eufriesea mexicana TaxID=516756 RepID=UPI00083C10FE|nr:PREDICTED: 28S ribosomal protein S23, mitochondrial [Eufriesea mexicana]